jgi:AraC-like DNA-binding protein
MEVHRLVAPPVPPQSFLADLESDWTTEISAAQKPLDFEAETFRRGADAGVLKQISRNGVRILFNKLGPLGRGTADVVRFDEGVEINVVNCVLPTLRRSTFAAEEPLIVLRASLCCDTVFRVEGAEPISFNRPELTLVCLPKGLRMTSDAAGGVRQQGVMGYFPPPSFAAAYGLKTGDLPAVVRDVVEGGAAFGRIVSLPLEHRIAGLVADTIDSPLDGEMLALQYAGRLTELVAYTFDAMRQVPAAQVRTLKRWRDADVAQLAMENLSRDYRRPPLFAELARELGTNSNRLQASFKSAFGITMAEYCLERRMREAQQLLLEAKLNVAQVAERVGYAHQSNFAAAFSAHVGMSPREYLKHRAPISLPLGLGEAAERP